MNKKLLTRLFALLASLVLVLALAIPCFASATYDDSQYVVKFANFTDRESLYQFLSLHTDGSLLGAVASIGGVITVEISNITPTYDTNTGELLHFTLEDIMITDVNDEGDGMTVVYLYYLVTPEHVRLNLEPNQVYYQDGNGQVSVDVHTLGYLNDNEWEAYQFSVTVKYLDVVELPEADPDEPIEPPVPENGWYSQIKNIIKEAVFGQDAVLNDSQEFTINQISLWLTLVVILLPLIVCAVILVRCFR